MNKIKSLIVWAKENWRLVGLGFAIIYAIYAVELNNATTLDHMWNFNGMDYILKDGEFPTVSFPLLTTDSFLRYLSSGRPSNLISNIIWWFLGIFGISIYTRQWVPKLLMMICLALTATIIVRLFDRFINNKKSQYIILVLALISFINPLFIEVWSYTALEWTLGILCGAVAVMLFTKKHYVWAGFFVWLSVGFYECYFEIFLILCTAYIFMKCKDRVGKDTLIEYFKMCMVGAIPVIINLVGQRIASILLNTMEVASNASANTVNEEVIQSSADVKAHIGISAFGDRIYHYGIEYFTHFVGDVFGYYTSYFLYGILFIIFVVTSMALYKKYGVKSVIHYMMFFSLEIVWFLIVFIGTEYWIEARIAWNVFMSISMMFTVFYIISESFDKRYYCIFYATFIIFSIVNIYTTNSKTTDYYIARASDHQYLDCIQAEIERYEERTGIKVEKIYTYERNDITQQSQYLLIQANVNAYDRRLVSKGWADVEALNYFEGENYISLSMTGEDYSKYFGDKKRYGKYVPEEQLVFDGDSLYWDIY